MRKTIVDFYTRETTISQVISKKLTDDGATWEIIDLQMEKASRAAFEEAIRGLVPEDINVLLGNIIASTMGFGFLI